LLLVSQVIQGKFERKVIIDLLRFIHLTLPICVGIECQNIKQGPKRTKVGKSYFAMASRNPVRRNILPGETKASSSRELEKQDKSTSPWRAEILPGEKRRFHLIKVTWQKPTGKESLSRHGEPNSARRNVTFLAYV